MSPSSSMSAFRFADRQSPSPMPRPRRAPYDPRSRGTAKGYTARLATKPCNRRKGRRSHAIAMARAGLIVPAVARSLFGAAANVRVDHPQGSPPTTHAPAEAVVSTFGHWLLHPTATNPCAAGVNSCGGNLPSPTLRTAEDFGIACGPTMEAVMPDRTTKALLLAIALGLWTSVLMQLVRPASADSYLLQGIKDHLHGIETYAQAIETNTSVVSRGVCSNRKLC